MDDFTDDLLALAGDGETQPTAPQSPAKPRTPPRKSSSPSSRYPSTLSQPQKGVARKMAKGAKSSAPRTSLQIHEDEPSPPSSPHHSLGSGAMSESESDGRSPSPDLAEESGSRYPVDGQFLSIKDRSEVMAMPEARREQILSERAEERERDAFNRQLRLRHENQQKENAKSADKKKRKATTADLDEPQRKVSKQKVKQNELLEGYKKQREQRNEQRQKDGDRRAHGPKSSSQDERGSGASGVESDVDWDEDHQRSGAPKDDPEPTLRQFERTRIGRTRFAQCCFIPGFEEAIKGCFVRVNIGPDPVTKELVYRMTRITGFKVGRPYQVENLQGKIFYTDLYAVCAMGKSEKEWAFIYTSDSKFTDREFEQYKEAAQISKARLPTVKQIDTKLAEIQALLDHRWKEGELTEKFRRQDVARKRLITMDREYWQEKRTNAAAMGDERQVQHYDDKLLALQQGKIYLANGASAPVKNQDLATKSLSQQDAIAVLNAKNRKANSEEVRRALLAEKRKQQQRQKAIARGEAAANPFARVKTLVKTHHDANNGDKKFDDLFESGRSRSATPLPKTIVKEKLAKGHVKGLKKKKYDDDFIGDLDINIDIDI